ncbi:MAG: HupE/UreJ family protein [Pseudomonadota bacterium]
MGKNLPLSFVFKVLLALWVSTLVAITTARAHEVQPAIMDISIGEETLAIEVDWMVEAAVAGLDLTNLADTNDADNAEGYDALRALPSAEFADRIRAAWPTIENQLQIMSGDRRLPVALEAVEVQDTADFELPRISRLTLAAPLPAGDLPIVIGWEPALGPLIVRQTDIENGYAAFLTPGMVSDPIPRTGGSDQTALEAFVDYVYVGFDHIVPQGLDHILFVLGLFFFSLRMGALLWQVTAFTLAHTVTLALGALDIIRLSPDIVEPIIAASIVYVGIENLFLRKLPPWRPFVIFGFGLLHGLGFASVLQEFGLGNDHFIPKLIGFNVGVEVGQLAVIAAAWITLALFFGRFGWYHRRIAAPVSVAIAIIAAFWVLERTGVVGTDGPWSLFSNLTEGGYPALWVLIAALGTALVLTVLEMMDVGEDIFREFAGMATSFLLFLGIVATFTAGAWVFSGIIAVAWVLALRFQSLGEPESAR